MWQKNISRIAATGITLLVCVLLIPGCARKIVDTGKQGQVAITIDPKIAAIATSESFDHFLLTVSGEDFDTIRVQMEIQDGFITAQLVLPVGRHRHFVTEAMDKINNVLYRGEVYADIPPTGVVQLNISLSPMVPMLRITPHFQRVEMDSSFSVDVSIHAVPNLKDISFYLTISDGPNSIKEIVKASGLASDVGLSYENGQKSAYIHFFWNGESPGIIVNDSGNAQLATVYFESHSELDIDTVTSRMSLEVIQMQDSSGGVIPTESIYTDNALIESHLSGTRAITIGGPSNDEGYAVAQTTDGGYIIAGLTMSYGAGSNDMFLVKTDASGNVTWQRTFGKAGSDWGNAVIQTSDGNYIVTGYFESYLGNYWDVAAAKATAAGDSAWATAFGSRQMGYGGFGMVATSDGGGVITGVTISCNHRHLFLLRISGANGQSVWSRTFGGANADYGGRGIARTSDGGYIITGETSTGSGWYDVYLVKTDSMGCKLWDKSFGGTSLDWGSAITITTDNKFIIAGYTQSCGFGGNDVYLIKTDASGNKIWAKTFGGVQNDEGKGVVATPDGGCLVVGSTQSFGAGLSDIYVVRVSSEGELVWQKTFGGTGTDVGYSIAPTSDGKYVIVGSTTSFGAGMADIYLIKIDGDGN